MAVLVYAPGMDVDALEVFLKKDLPDLDLRLWPVLGDVEEIDILLIWGKEPGLYAKLPNLKTVYSLGAGVNHILEQEDLPEHVQVLRLEDAGMGEQMAQYALWCALTLHRQFDTYRDQQAERKWGPLAPVSAENFTIGVMGLGVLGQAVAERLRENGYRVKGWARSNKSWDWLECYAGPEGIDEFASDLDLLICLLPPTLSTKGILNRTLFDRMKDGASIVNLARGSLQVEDDIVAALATGKLRHAFLDVTETEPLPADSVMWKHPGITLTPHISAATIMEEAGEQIADNLRRIAAGQEPLHIVDRDAGY